MCERVFTHVLVRLATCSPCRTDTMNAIAFTAFLDASRFGVSPSTTPGISSLNVNITLKNTNDVILHYITFYHYYYRM